MDNMSLNGPACPFVITNNGSCSETVGSAMFRGGYTRYILSVVWVLPHHSTQIVFVIVHFIAEHFRNGKFVGLKSGSAGDRIYIVLWVLFRPILNDYTSRSPKQWAYNDSPSRLLKPHVDVSDIIRRQSKRIRLIFQGFSNRRLVD